MNSKSRSTYLATKFCYLGDLVLEKREELSLLSLRGAPLPPSRSEEVLLPLLLDEAPLTVSEIIQNKINTENERKSVTEADFEWTDLFFLLCSFRMVSS